MTTTFCLFEVRGDDAKVFYPNFIPDADEDDFVGCPIIPNWVKSMRQFKPKRIASEVVGVIKRNLISYSMVSDLRMTVQSGSPLILVRTREESMRRGMNWRGCSFSSPMCRGFRPRMRLWRSGWRSTSSRPIKSIDLSRSLSISERIRCMRLSGVDV